MSWLTITKTLEVGPFPEERHEMDFLHSIYQLAQGRGHIVILT